MMALILSIPLTKKSGAGVVHRADSCDTVWFADSAGSTASVFCMAPLLIISMDTRLLIPESPPSRMASTPVSYTHLYCHQLFKLLTWESAFFSSESEANITHLLRVLFSKLREGTQNESPGIHDHELVALHKMIYNNPQLPWNINMMAAKLHLSPSHLQTLYPVSYTHLDVYKRQFLHHVGQKSSIPDFLFQWQVYFHPSC